MSYGAARRAIKDATYMVILCGAGMGVDAGLATFRGRNQESQGRGPIERNEETPYSMCKLRQLHYAQAAQQIELSVSSSLLAGKQQSSQTQDVHSEHRKTSA
jgi:NAD-dependent SIR2 family protein deacetylase